MKNNVLYKCAHLVVECAKNDPVDVRAGGPAWLGFDFFVNDNETEKMIEYIDAALASLEIPNQAIYISEFVNLPANKLWTKERILAEIQKEAEYLKHEASRNYGDATIRK